MSNVQLVPQLVAVAMDTYESKARSDVAYPAIEVVPVMPNAGDLGAL